MVSQRLRYAKYYMGILWKNWTQTRESYAQHGEDLLAESLLSKIRSFIDVGANDGVLFSVTNAATASVDANQLIGLLWRRPHHLAAGLHLFRVESKANIGDAGSRDDLAFVDLLDATHVEPNLADFVLDRSDEF